MKNILVLAHDDDGQEARMQVALDLGRALAGHVTCLGVIYVPPIAGGGFAEDAYALADLMTEGTTRERTNRARLETRLAGEGVPWDWIEATGDIAPCIAQAAALADVIVVNRTLDDASVIDMRRTAGELIVRSGRPVLAVPGHCKGLDPSSALVAWDGSPCAATALRAAVPLLALADHVILFEVEDGSIEVPTEDAARYLSRHGIHAVIRRVAVPFEGVAARIVDEATTGSFGYVVMGGYGHHRFVEAMFGGVTRAMLNTSPIPVLMAH